jgi:site-specific DNA-methyltransferase (adenine-specific)
MKKRAPRNRTLTVTAVEKPGLLGRTITLSKPVKAARIKNKIIHQDLFEAVEFLPDRFIDLLIIDPPYNLSKSYHGSKFAKTTPEKYESWFESWLSKLIRCLKPTASVYVCCDWQSSASVRKLLQNHFIIRNRITWEREKGRGAAANWKNCSEDIWFCTQSADYYFDVAAVKTKRRVLAPYRDKHGRPRDWDQTQHGNFRLTHPSNLWTDISVPFWSMPENTDHPTQKPEKLIAKLILASSKPGDFVFDPFAGSGSTCVVAKKLARKYAGVEIEEQYCCMAVKRLRAADKDTAIQGYRNGCFWERNTLNQQKST